MEYGVSPRTRKIKKKFKEFTQKGYKPPEQFFPVLADLKPRKTPISALIASRKSSNRKRKNRIFSLREHNRTYPLRRKRLRSAQNTKRRSRGKPPKRKDSAKVRPFQHMSYDRANCNALEEATFTEFSSEGFRNKSSTANRKNFGVVSGGTSAPNMRDTFHSDSKIIGTVSVDSNWDELDNSEVTGVNNGNICHSKVFGNDGHDLQGLIDMLQVEMKRYQAAVKQQAGDSFQDSYENHIESFGLKQQQTLTESLQRTISKYRSLMSNISNEPQSITSRSLASKEASTLARENANSTIEQKNGLITSLVRKQMKDAEELNEAMNSLISKSRQEFNGNVDLIKTRSNSDHNKDKLLLLNQRYKTKIENLEKKIRNRDSELSQLQLDFNHVSKKMDIMKRKRSISSQGTSVNNSSIERVCDKAENLNKRLQTKTIRSLIRYIDFVDKKESSDRKRLIFLLREKIENFSAQEVLVSKDEGFLETELVKLKDISLDSVSLNTPGKLLLSKTIDGITETCDLLKNYISALGNRATSCRQEIRWIQNNEIKHHSENSLNRGNWTSISSSIKVHPKADVHVLPQVFFQSNPDGPMPVETHDNYVLEEDSKKVELIKRIEEYDYKEKIFKNCTQVPDKRSSQTSSINNIEDAEQKVIATSEIERTKVSVEPSVQKSHISISSNKGFVRSPKFHVSLTAQPQLEFNAIPLEESRARHNNKEDHQIINSKHLHKSKKIECTFPIEDHSVVLSSASTKNEVQSGHREKQTVKIAKDEGAFAGEAESPSLMVQTANKISDGVNSIASQNRLTGGFEELADTNPALEVCTKRDSMMINLLPVIASDCVKESTKKYQGSAIVKAMKPKLLQKAMSLNFYPTSDVSGSRKHDQASNTVTMPESPIKSKIPEVHASPKYNSVKEIAKRKLSDLLGNCSQKNKNDTLNFTPLEIYLQNTLCREDAQRWMKGGTLNSSSIETQKQKSTNQEPQPSASIRFRRLSLKMGLNDYKKKPPPYCDKRTNDKRTVLLKTFMGNYKVKIGKDVQMLPLSDSGRLSPLPKDGKLIEKTQYSGARADITSQKNVIFGNTDSSYGRWDSSSELNVKKYDKRRRFSVHRGELTKSMAKLKFSYSDLIYSQLNDYGHCFTEEENEYRIVNAMARAKVLMRKLYYHMKNKNNTDDFGLYNTYIYREIRAAFTNSCKHTDLDTGFAQKKVLSPTDNIKVVKNTVNQVRKPRLSNSKKKQDSSSIKVFGNVQSLSTLENKIRSLGYVHVCAGEPNVQEMTQSTKRTETNSPQKTKFACSKDNKSTDIHVRSGFAQPKPTIIGYKEQDLTKGRLF